jgi:hypothetical protein
MFEFAATFAGEVEEAANHISRETDDPAIRRRALMWKIHAIPAAQMACFRRDPLAATLDTWILCSQMEDFFTDGAGSTLFGPRQSVAIDTSRRLHERMRAIVGTFTRTPEGVQEVEREAVEPWVERYPIEDLQFTRDSAMALYAHLLREQGHDAFASVRTLEELAIDATRQLRVYANQIPKHLRWHAELVRQQTLASEPVQALVAHLSSLEDLAGVAEKGVEQIEGLTAELDRQREAILAALREERMAITEAVAQERGTAVEAFGQERSVILAHVTEERELALEAINAQRRETLDWIGDELAVLVEAMKKERAATVAEMETLTRSALGQSRAELETVVDHAFWRLVQLLLVALVAAPFIARVYRIVLRRPS